MLKGRSRWKKGLRVKGKEAEGKLEGEERKIMVKNERRRKIEIQAGREIKQ